jgi:hypothetical protein
MFSDLATLRATLAERLTPQLPADWRMVDHIEGYTESLVPVVFFEFTEFGSSAGGQPLPRSAVAASIDVVVTTPRTDYDGGAETDVDSHVLRIVQVIVQADDLFFSTARKVQLDNGPLAWRVSLTALTNIAPSEGE